MSGMVHISRNPATPESIRQDFIYTLFEAQNLHCSWRTKTVSYNRVWGVFKGWIEGVNVVFWNRWGISGLSFARQAVWNHFGCFPSTSVS